MAIDRHGYTRIPNGYMNVLEGISNLIDAKLDGDEHTWWDTLFTAFVDSLEQDYRWTQTGGKLHQLEQFTTEDYFAPGADDATPVRHYDEF